MNKNVIMTYNGMNQDISQSKFSNQFYFEARNIRILATDSQSTNSVSNEKGNSLHHERLSMVSDDERRTQRSSC